MNDKKLLYIQPYYLPYYDLYNSFCVNSYSYIIGNVYLKDQFKQFIYLDTKYWPKKVQFQKIYVKINGLYKVIKKMNFNFIITKEIFSPISYTISKINKRIKFKHIIYCDETTKFNNSLWGLFPITRYYAKYNVNSNNYYIASSKLILDNLLNMGIPRSHILLMHISIYPEKFKESKLNDECHNILFIGNLEKNKGIITIIRAFNMINKKNIKLHIAGRGTLKDFVLENATKNKNIIYHGYVTEPDKIKLLFQADMFLYPSEDIILPLNIKRWEEQGAVSALEAMAAGLPVIGSDSGALPEILGKNIIVRQGDFSELAKQILFLCSNHDIRKELHEYNMKRIKEEYNINKNKIILNNFLNNIET
ncbi:glycosyltransferase family 4 protein [Cuniculiplasma sp. SKW4]|uniref:glycosyltransferase family 4 protein n=1 Tax=Cuniculiplasma sp. SKW4 TaxID=3400171 RepID=UPI003FCF9DA9